MSTFRERFDSNRRVGLYVVRKERNLLYLAALILALPFAPIAWAYFARKYPEQHVASKDKYP